LHLNFPRFDVAEVSQEHTQSHCILEVLLPNSLLGELLDFLFLFLLAISGYKIYVELAF